MPRYVYTTELPPEAGERLERIAREQGIDDIEEFAADVFGRILEICEQQLQQYREDLASQIELEKI